MFYWKTIIYVCLNNKQRVQKCWQCHTNGVSTGKVLLKWLKLFTVTIWIDHFQWLFWGHNTTWALSTCLRSHINQVLALADEVQNKVVRNKVVKMRTVIRLERLNNKPTRPSEMKNTSVSRTNIVGSSKNISYRNGWRIMNNTCVSRTMV